MAADQPKSDRYLPRFLLLRLLLVPVCHLAAGLPGDGAALHHFARRLLLSLPYFVFGASEPVGGWIADRLIAYGWDETRTRKGIVTVAFLCGLFLIPASRVDSAYTAVALIAGGSLVGLATGNLLVILQCCAPHEDIGLWTGFENFAGNIAGVVAPLLTGLIISRTGSYAPGFMLAAIVLLVGIICYWFIVGNLGSRRRSCSRSVNHAAHSLHHYGAVQLHPGCPGQGAATTAARGSRR